MNRDMILGLIRHALTIGGGFLVAKGTIDAPGLDTAVGALVTIIGVAWSIFDKRTPAA
jgi:hypothetical protein